MTKGIGDIDTQKLQEALDRLTVALESAAGISGQLNSFSAATTQATQQVTANANANRQSTAVTVKTLQEQRRMAQAASNAADSLGHLATSVTSVARAMYEGQKGASAFNGTIDSMSQAVARAGSALALMFPGGPLIKGLIAGVTAISTAVFGAAKEINKMTDTLHKGYQGISQSGAAASDGMTGLLSDVHKLGLGFQDLDQYTRIVSESSAELALFGGTVFKGRQRFADLGEAMTPYRASLIALGMSQEEINESMASYIRLQSRVGRTQNLTVDELAESARRYLIEQDALTKLTGMTRKEQEDAREAIRSQERFAALSLEMNNKGLGANVDAMERTITFVGRYNKDLAQGLNDISSGFLTTAAAQKAYRLTQGEAMRVMQMMAAGQIDEYEANQRLAKAAGDTATRLSSLGKLGVFGDFYGDFYGSVRLGQQSMNDIVEQGRLIREEQDRQGALDGKHADERVRRQTNIILDQQNTMIALQKMMALGINPTQRAMQGLAYTINRLTQGFQRLINMIPGIKPGTAAQENAYAATIDAEFEIVQTRRDVVNAEHALVKAREQGAKAEIAAAEEFLAAAKASEDAAQKQLLTAREQKLAADSAAPKSALEQATRFGIMGLPRQLERMMLSVGNRMTGGSATGTSTTSSTAPIPKSGTSATAGTAVSAAPAAAGGGGDDNPAEQDLADQLFKFLGKTAGHRRNFDQLDAEFRTRLTAMAKEYQGLTGKTIGFSSGARNPLENQRVGGVGSSLHLEGKAVDLSSDSVAELAKLGLLDRYGFKQNRRSPWHISDTGFAKGGIATGPKSGYNTLLHGTEAVVPLPDGKTIPVSMNQSTGAAADNSELLQVMREVKSSIESMTNRADNQRVVAVLEDSIRAQRTSNDILGKILQMSQ
jgi:uncharacterized protein YcbK (DUF882 family)